MNIRKVRKIYGSMHLTDRAKTFATHAHQGQLYNGDNFMVHPTEVSKVLQALLSEQGGQDDDLIAAAYLHDVLEDTSVSYRQLKREFGKNIADLVREVTDAGWNIFPHLKTQRGIMLKFADRLANLSHIHDWTEENQEKYIRKSTFWKKEA